MSQDVGPQRRTFTYDTGAVGRHFLGVLAAPLPVMGLVALVLLPLSADQDRSTRSVLSTVATLVICPVAVAAFGYFLWSASQVSPFRTVVFTIHRDGLVRSNTFDPVHLLPAATGDVIRWASIVDVFEERPASRLARIVLPPSRRYRAGIAVDEGWALLVTAATKDAPELVAMVRKAAGLT